VYGSGTAVALAKGTSFFRLSCREETTHTTNLPCKGDRKTVSHLPMTEPQPVGLIVNYLRLT